MSREAARPNVLLIMCDQMQWQIIANRSLCRMPNVQRIVDSGLLFDRSYTPCALCCPARAMLLSGAYHWQNGVINQVHVAPSVSRDMWPDVITYSQRIKDAGYALAYVGKWHASYKRTPLDFGFDKVRALSGLPREMLQALPCEREFMAGFGPDPGYKILHQRLFQWPGSEPFAMWATVEGDESKTMPAWVADGAAKTLGEMAAGEKPWHVEVHFQAPHNAYFPLKKYVDRYDPQDIAVPPSFYDTFGGKPNLHKRESSLWEPLTGQDYREGLAHYFAYCEELDVQIGRVLDALEATGQSANTLVVFTADHGDMAGAHRMWIKGWMPYEECYRIPLVIRWPGHIRPGSRTDHLVQLHDFGHTCVDLLGLEPLPYAHGRSWAPLFEDPQRDDWDDTILNAFNGAEFLYTQRMIVTHRYKYVFNAFDFDEMYDLQEDPHEMRNIADDPACAQAADKLRLKMYEKMEEVEDPYVKGGIYTAQRYLKRPR